MDAAPARLEPIFTPRIWGARSLAPLYPDMSELSEPIGEAWLTARESRFVNGPSRAKRWRTRGSKCRPNGAARALLSKRNFRYW